MCSNLKLDFFLKLIHILFVSYFDFIFFNIESEFLVALLMRNLHSRDENAKSILKEFISFITITKNLRIKV